METPNQPSNSALPKKDLALGFLSGLLIGLLALPVIKAAKPDLYEKIWLVIVPFFLVGTPLGLFIAYKISQKIAVIWQLGKFGVTGVLNVLVDLGILSMLTFFLRSTYGINPEKVVSPTLAIITVYTLYKAGSFIVANINSYLWNKYWTFHKEEGGKSSEFVQFFIVSLIGFIINVLIASLVFKFGHVSSALSIEQWELIGAALGSIVGLVWNFLGYKFIVFKK